MQAYSEEEAEFGNHQHRQRAKRGEDTEEKTQTSVFFFLLQKRSHKVSQGTWAMIPCESARRGSV